jgi:LacI family transcriptional regulator
MAITLKDIARQVGLSVTTVSRALGGYDDVAEESRQRIVATAQALGYTPNVSARRLQKQRTDMLGLIIPTYGPRFSDPFFSEIITSIGDEAAKHDFDLLVSTCPPDSEVERQVYGRAVNGVWVDGLIVVRTRENDSRIKFLVKHGFPFVAYGRIADNLDFPYVDIDSRYGMRLLVQHLIDLGHRQIGFISPPEDLLFGHFRRQAYWATLIANGIEVNPEWIAYGDLTETSGVNAGTKLLTTNPQPTAIIGGNDLMAIGAMKAINDFGLRVGRDVAVGGFDDIPLAAFTNPPLTTVRQPIHEMSGRACAILIDIILKRQVEEKRILYQPMLIERESSGFQRKHGR